MSDLSLALLDIAAAVKKLKETPNPEKTEYDVILAQIMGLLLKIHKPQGDDGPPPAKRVKPAPDKVGTSGIPIKDIQRLAPEVVQYVLTHFLRKGKLRREEHDRLLQTCTSGTIRLTERHIMDGEGPGNIRTDMKNLSFAPETIEVMTKYRLSLKKENKPAKQSMDIVPQNIPMPIFTTPAPLPMNHM